MVSSFHNWRSLGPGFPGSTNIGIGRRGGPTTGLRVSKSSMRMGMGSTGKRVKVNLGSGRSWMAIMTRQISRVPGIIVPVTARLLISVRYFPSWEMRQRPLNSVGVDIKT